MSSTPIRGPLGRHLLLELYECPPALLNNPQTIESHLMAAAEFLHTRVVDTSFHHFSPYGVSGVVVIAESHITIHTWPEYGYAAVDVFSCDQKIDIISVCALLQEKFAAQKITYSLYNRGQEVDRGENAGLPLNDKK